MYQSIDEEQQKNRLSASSDANDVEKQESTSGDRRSFVLVSLLVCVFVSLMYSTNNFNTLTEISDKQAQLVSTGLASYTSSATYTRKEIRQCSKEELEAYFDAVWALKETGRQDGRPYLQMYDDFVAQHALAAANTTMDQAHLFAAFTVWHSLLTYEFELALRSINPNVSIPYWDWTIDEATGDPSGTEILTDKYFGKANRSNDYIVDNGYVAYWPVT
jgi:hypothetical protein